MNIALIYNICTPTGPKGTNVEQIKNACVLVLQDVPQNEKRKSIQAKQPQRPTYTTMKNKTVQIMLITMLLGIGLAKAQKVHALRDGGLVSVHDGHTLCDAS